MIVTKRSQKTETLSGTALMNARRGRKPRFFRWFVDA